MKINELKKILDSKNIPKDSYSLLDNAKDESLCMQNKNGFWIVFYSERGLKTNEKEFTIEDQACEYFLKKITAWFT